MRTSTLLILASLVSAAGCSGTWSRRSVVTTYVASSVLVACDMGQTIWASNNGRWDRRSSDGVLLLESNPVYGERPSVGTLMMVAFTNAVIGVIAVHSPLPDWMKLAWFGGLTAVETRVVVNNWTDAKTGACGLIGQGPTTTGDR